MNPTWEPAGTLRIIEVHLRGLLFHLIFVRRSSKNLHFSQRVDSKLVSSSAQLVSEGDTGLNPVEV